MNIKKPIASLRAGEGFLSSEKSKKKTSTKKASVKSASKKVKKKPGDEVVQLSIFSSPTTKINSKLIDSKPDISKGGRALSYWAGRFIKPNSKYAIDNLPAMIDQQKVIDKFSLRGFEYGNWLSNEERHDRLAATTESLLDLTRVMKSNNIGCDGMIGIAFGARGKTKAAAHFEPSTFMINLTKEKGYGALAHEYGHALDYFFGLFVDQDPGHTSLTGGRSLVRELKPTGGDLRSMAVVVVNTATTDNGQESESYKRWLKLPGSYWIRRNEIFARTYEQYVRYKLNEKKIKNTFLSEEKYQNAAYLTTEDFKRVLPKIERLVNEMSKFMNNKRLSVSSTSQAAKKAGKSTGKLSKR